MFSDLRIADADLDGSLDGFYTLDVKDWTDYYAFGSAKPNRKAPVTAESYRYGFNGAESDDEVAGTKNHYDLGLRNYDPRIGRMWKVDPRYKEYPWQTAYAYHRNSPISMIDFLGGGDYYKTDGSYLGNDGNDDDKTFSADGMTSTTNEETGETTNSFTNANDLNISHTSFTQQSATVYGESSAYKMNTVTDDLKNEMKAIAQVHQTNDIAYGATSDKAQEYLNMSAEGRSASSFKRAATAAMIHVMTGGEDMSNGATMWDGKEQSQYPATDNSFSKDGFELHMNTMGWSISDDLFSTWSTNVGSSFQAPQEKAAPGNYGQYTNSGKKRLNATAVYGETIFWKVVD